MKIIVSNFDKTLIDEEEAISTKTMLEIDNLRNQKYKFIITSSRNYEEILNYNKSYPFIDYIIALNGSYVYDVNKNKCVYKKSIAYKDIKPILPLLDKEQVVFETANSSLERKEVKENKYPIYQIRIKNYKKAILKDLLNITNLNISKENADLIINNSDKLSAYKKIFSEKNNQLTVIAHDETDYDLLKQANYKYILKTVDPSLKKILKKDTNYIVKETIEDALKSIKD